MPLNTYCRYMIHTNMIHFSTVHYYFIDFSVIASPFKQIDDVNTEFQIVSGYYCPNGTTHSYEYPCPPGTYNGHESAESLAECLSCPKGKYCEGYGNSNYTAECDAGWYCTGGADSSNTTTHGGECQPGYYCPQGKDTELIVVCV